MCVLRWVLWLKVEGHTAHLKHFELIPLSEETVFAISSGKGSCGIIMFSILSNKTRRSTRLLVLVRCTDRGYAAFLGELSSTCGTDSLSSLYCHDKSSWDLKVNLTF